MMVSALGLTAIPAAAEPASLTVAVTDAATGAPIPEPCVSVYEAPWSFVSRVCGSVDGVVTVTGLDSAVNYKASVQGPPEYAEAFVGGGTSLYSPAVFSVPRNDTVALSPAARAGNPAGPDWRSRRWLLRLGHFRERSRNRRLGADRRSRPVEYAVPPSPG